MGILEQLIFLPCLLILCLTIVILVRLRRSLQQKRLQRWGRLVLAMVTQVRQEEEERGPVDEFWIRYCYYIHAEWTDINTGQTYLFTSERLASYPQDYSPGAIVAVYMDSHNPVHYFMELNKDTY